MQSTATAHTLFMVLFEAAVSASDSMMTSVIVSPAQDDQAGLQGICRVGYRSQAGPAVMPLLGCQPGWS